MGSISGLNSGSVSLANNGVVRSLNAGETTFQFPNLISGENYDVTIQSITSSEVCEVLNGQGQISDKDVIDVQVVCETEMVQIAGTVLGLFFCPFFLHFVVNVCKVRKKTIVITFKATSNIAENNFF